MGGQRRRRESVVARVGRIESLVCVLAEEASCTRRARRSGAEQVCGAAADVLTNHRPPGHPGTRLRICSLQDSRRHETVKLKIFGHFPSKISFSVT